MAFPALVHPNQVPLDTLFPESYEASKKEIARDFVFFGFLIVGSVLFAATLNWMMNVQAGL